MRVRRSFVRLARSARGCACWNGKGSVELANVTKRFADVVAVDDVSLQVMPGGVPLAAGALGLRQDDHAADARRLRGADRRRHPDLRSEVRGTPPHRRNVNTVFQHFALFPHMSVAENVAYGLRQKKEERIEIGRQVDEALEMVKMSPSRTGSRASCPVASSSASRSRAPW